MDGPHSYDDYLRADPERARRTCLHMATVLGDVMRTDLTIVGGLTPSLLVRQDATSPDHEAHCGTQDVDIGLSLAIVDDETYAEVAKRLRSHGFAADKKATGETVVQRWRTPPGLPAMTIDFLIPPLSPDDRPSSIRHLEGDFGAIVTPGLQLVSRDWLHVDLFGRTLHGETAARTVRVCGPGAFIVLKARALHNRGEGKDAYDLFYILRHFGSSIKDVASALIPLLDDAHAAEALTWLRSDYADIDSLGPVRTALFRLGQPDDETQADALGLVRELLRLVERAV